jgi:hypothetical protein
MFDWLKKSAASPAIQIRLKSSLVCKSTSDTTARPYEKGDVIHVMHRTLSELDRSDFEIVNAPVVEVTDPTPERPSPEPMPAAWKNLPACFREWHELAEEFRIAREYRVLIRNERQRVTGIGGSVSGAEGKILSLGYVDAGPMSQDVIVRSNLIDLEDPRVKKLHRFFDTSIAAADDYYERLQATKSAELNRLRWECGLHRIEQAERLQVVIDELAAVGFELFATRVAALGLHPAKIRELFCGSADHARFSVAQSTSSIDVVSTGLCQEDGPIRVADESPVTSASHALNEAKRLAELTPLLKTARSELARAQKLTAQHLTLPS